MLQVWISQSPAVSAYCSLFITFLLSHFLTQKKKKKLSGVRFKTHWNIRTFTSFATRFFLVATFALLLYLYESREQRRMSMNGLMGKYSSHLPPLRFTAAERKLLQRRDVFGKVYTVLSCFVVIM